MVTTAKDIILLYLFVCQNSSGSPNYQFVVSLPIYHLSICLSICLSSIYASMCLCIYISMCIIYLSTYQSHNEKKLEAMFYGTMADYK